MGVLMSCVGVFLLWLSCAMTMRFGDVPWDYSYCYKYSECVVLGSWIYTSYVIWPFVPDHIHLWEPCPRPSPPLHDHLQFANMEGGSPGRFGHLWLHHMYMGTWYSTSLNGERYWYCLVNSVASSPRTDSTRKGFEIHVHCWTPPCMYTYLKALSVRGLEATVLTRQYQYCSYVYCRCAWYG